MKKILLFILAIAFAHQVTVAQWIFAGLAFQATVRGLYFHDINNGFAVGGDGVSVAYISKTTDGGENWNSTVIPGSSLIRSVTFTDENTGYACGAGGIVLKTSNGGSSWDVIYSDPTQYFRCIDFTSPQVAFMAGAAGTILKSTDSGFTWSTYNLNIPGSDVIQVKMANANVGYAVLSDGISPFGFGYVFKTVDSGNSWSQVYFNASKGLLSLAVVNADTVYAGGSLQTIIQTSDGGVTWETTHSGVTNAFRAAAATSHQVYFSDDGGNIFNTNDGGDSWELSAEFVNGVLALYFPDDNHGYMGDIEGNIWHLSVCPKPFVGLVSKVSATSAKLTWTEVPDAIGYKVSYRQVGSGVAINAWTTDSFKILTNLVPNKKYGWTVQSVCSNSPLVTSGLTRGNDFTTKPMRLSEESAEIVNVEVFPNPISAFATIRFSIEVMSSVKIVLIDLKGSQVLEIENSNYSPGTYNSTFDSKKIPSGVYMIQLITDESLVTRKIFIDH